MTPRIKPDSVVYQIKKIFKKLRDKAPVEVQGKVKAKLEKFKVEEDEEEMKKN